MKLYTRFENKYLRLRDGEDVGYVVVFDMTCLFALAPGQVFLVVVKRPFFFNRRVVCIRGKRGEWLWI